MLNTGEQIYNFKIRFGRTNYAMTNEKCDFWGLRKRWIGTKKRSIGTKKRYTGGYKKRLVLRKDSDQPCSLGRTSDTVDLS